MIFVKLVFSPTAENFGVSAQIVPDGPEVRFHERSTRVPPGSNEGMSPELIFLGRATVLNLFTVYFGQLDCFQGLPTCLADDSREVGVFSRASN